MTPGVLCALVSLSVLIYLIHQVSVSIQADEVVARIGNELDRGVDRLFSERVGTTAALSPQDASSTPTGLEDEARLVPACGDGYLQFADADLWMELAQREDVIVRLERRHGEYVIVNGTVLRVWSAERAPEEFVRELLPGNQRTSAQDVEFGIHQLVEIAVRAPSPGVDERFTALTCVDRPGSVLCRIARRDEPRRMRFDSERGLRVIATPFSFVGAVDAAFHTIRQHSRASTALCAWLLDTIAVVAGSVRTAPGRNVLRRRADRIVSGAREAVPEAYDRAHVEDRYRAAVSALAAGRA